MAAASSTAFTVDVLLTFTAGKAYLFFLASAKTFPNSFPEITPNSNLDIFLFFLKLKNKIKNIVSILAINLNIF